MLPELINLTLSALAPFLPQAVVDSAVREAVRLGYAPCAPSINITERGLPYAGTGAWPEAFGVCEIELTPETVEDKTKGYLTYVARHEVCHLSTGHAIDQAGSSYADPHHDHPLFFECLAALSSLPGLAPAEPSTAFAQLTPYNRLEASL